jgi:acetate---CoA ligase (ADP-forming)
LHDAFGLHQFAPAPMIRTSGAVLLMEPALVELDPDPVILHPAGQGATALGALLMLVEGGA